MPPLGFELEVYYFCIFLIAIEKKSVMVISKFLSRPPLNLKSGYSHVTNIRFGRFALMSTLSCTAFSKKVVIVNSSHNE